MQLLKFTDAFLGQSNQSPYRVLLAGNSYKVFGSVVILYPIKVVNQIIFRQLAFIGLFPNEVMFKSISANTIYPTDINFNVSSPSANSATPPIPMLFTRRSRKTLHTINSTYSMQSLTTYFALRTFGFKLFNISPVSLHMFIITLCIKVCQRKYEKHPELREVSDATTKDKSL